jgi:hypothetical protein
LKSDYKMNYLYGLFISNKVSFNQVATIVGNYTNVPYEKIGKTIDEYYEKFDTTDKLQMGINIWFYNRGYKTYINVDRPEFGLTDSQLIRLACKLATELNSNVAIGDLAAIEEFTYVIISPDRKYQKAYGIDRRKEDEEDEITEFTTYTEKADMSEYFSSLNGE